MKRLLPTIAAALVFFLSGYLHGITTDRWGVRADVETAARRLDLVPATIGDWSSREVPVSEKQMMQAAAVGHLSRHYVNRTTGRAVDVMILCGRHGPISVHPPTVCFTSSGWALKNAPERFTVTSKDKAELGNFWMAHFSKSSQGVPVRIRTFWSWSVGDHWKAADTPRISFAHSPYLYKIYVTSQVDYDSTPPADGAGVEFMQVFLPELDKALAEP